MQTHKQLNSHHQGAFMRTEVQGEQMLLTAFATERKKGAFMLNILVS